MIDKVQIAHEKSLDRYYEGASPLPPSLGKKWIGLVRSNKIRIKSCLILLRVNLFNHRASNLIVPSMFLSGFSPVIFIKN